MLTIDGDFHRRPRRTMLPAFHHERVQAARGVMDEEIERALAPWEDGLELDLYGWARDLALRVAMRACSGSIQMPAPTGSPRRASSSARSASTAASTGSRCCAGRARPGRPRSTRAAASTG
jgi:cytochrome P450